MKPTVEQIAQAAVDAALESLKAHGLEKEAKHLPQLLRAAATEKADTVIVTVTSANGDAGHVLTSLKKTLHEKLGKDIEIVEKKDSAILGGLIIEYGDERIDTSVRNALKNAKTALTLS